MSPSRQPGAATTPPPTAKIWKYLDNPSAPEWLRSRSEVAFPNIGDFAVLSIDPVASVGHLDRVARRAAAALPVRRYVVLVYSLTGLPINSKPTNPYRVLFVRKGLPTPRLHDYDSAQSCIAILPNTHTIAPSFEPLQPAQPLPWEGCYLDVTYGFPYPCRVTSVKRDYTPVLPVIDDEVTRVETCLQPYGDVLYELRHEHGVSWREPLDLVEATPLLTDGRPTTHTTGSPLYDENHSNEHMYIQRETDDISIIGSDDESASGDDESDSDSADDEELDMLLNFEHMLFNAGDVRDPVVNVWYDLDMVTEITDPVHFLEDVKRLRIIMDEAEVRLGLRPDPAAESASSENAGSPSIIKDQSEKADERSAITPTEAVPQNPSMPTPTLTARLRAYLRSLVAKCSAYVRALVQRLIPRRRKKVAKSKVKTS